MTDKRIQDEAYQALSSHIGNVGIVLKKARLERGLDAYELAELSGLDLWKILCVEEEDYFIDLVDVQRLFLTLRAYDIQQKIKKDD